MKNLDYFRIALLMLCCQGFYSYTLAEPSFTEKDYMRYRFIWERLEKFKGDLTGIEEPINLDDALSFFANSQVPIYNEISGSHTTIETYLRRLRQRPKQVFYYEYQFAKLKKTIASSIKCDVYIRRQAYQNEELVLDDLLLVKVAFGGGLKISKFRITAIELLPNLPTGLIDYKNDIEGKLEALIEKEINTKYGGLTADHIQKKVGSFFNEYKNDFSSFLHGDNSKKKIFRIRLLKKFEKDGSTLENDLSLNDWNSRIRVDQYFDRIWGHRPNSEFIYQPKQALVKQANRLFSKNFDTETIITQRKLVNGHFIDRNYHIGLTKINPKRGLIPKRLYIADIRNHYVQPNLKPMEIREARDSVHNLLASFQLACQDAASSDQALIMRFFANSQRALTVGENKLPITDYISQKRALDAPIEILKLLPHQATINNYYFIVVKAVFGPDSLNVAVQFQRDKTGTLFEFRIDRIIVTGSASTPDPPINEAVDLLVESLEDNHLKADWIKVKARIRYDARKLDLPIPQILKKGQCSALIKIQSGKQLSISIRKFGIEIFKLNIDEKGIRAVNRLLKEYHSIPFSYLSEVYGVPVSLEDIEHAIVGSPVFLQTDSMQIAPENEYRLTGHLAKLETQYWLDRESLFLRKLALQTPDRKARLEILQTDYQPVAAGIAFSQSRNITFYDEAMGQLGLRIKIQQLILDKALHFNLEIPANYQQANN